MKLIFLAHDDWAKGNSAKRWLGDNIFGDKIENSQVDTGTLKTSSKKQNNYLLRSITPFHGSCARTLHFFQLQLAN